MQKVSAEAVSQGCLGGVEPAHAMDTARNVLRLIADPVIRITGAHVATRFADRPGLAPGWGQAR